jgi:hypothetical protein
VEESAQETMHSTKLAMHTVDQPVDQCVHSEAAPSFKQLCVAVELRAAPEQLDGRGSALANGGSQMCVCIIAHL